MSVTSSDTIAFEIICLIAESSSSLGLPVGVDVLTRPAFTAWKNPFFHSFRFQSIISFQDSYNSLTYGTMHEGSWNSPFCTLDLSLQRRDNILKHKR